MKQLFPLLFVFVLGSHSLLGNNLQITNVTLTGADLVNDYTKIKFDVSWDNSWRDIINWDAVWIFAKYSTDNGLTWLHAWLNTTPGNHTVPAAATLSVGVTNITATDRGMGVFIHRSASGSGGINWTNVQLRWDYGVQGIGDYASVMIKVFGIEMVYLRDGSFWLGDGTTSAIAGQFETGTGGAPFELTSEGQLTLGGGGIGSLGNNNASGMMVSDDFSDAISKTLPAAFPKGYDAFYCMKYELTQEQYKDFLNTLTRAQQENRVASDITGSSVTNRYVMSNSAAILSRNGIRCEATIPASGPVTLYCDYDGDGVYDETTDGQNIPCNRISGEDMKAYLDWSGLRPITELEFEKACRGPVFPVVDEYAWGSTTAVWATSFLNAGMPTEQAGNSGANCSAGVSPGPIRAGAFAGAATSRQDAGASYWGIMELSGGEQDMCVSVGIGTSRTFTGLHGNGELSTTGFSNVTSWPSSLSLRGGYYASAMPLLRISSRYQAAYTLGTSRFADIGGRGGRTAP